MWHSDWLKLIGWLAARNILLLFIINQHLRASGNGPTLFLAKRQEMLLLDHRYTVSPVCKTTVAVLSSFPCCRRVWCVAGLNVGHIILSCFPQKWTSLQYTFPFLVLPPQLREMLHFTASPFFWPFVWSSGPVCGGTVASDDQPLDETGRKCIN